MRFHECQSSDNFRHHRQPVQTKSNLNLRKGCYPLPQEDYEFPVSGGLRSGNAIKAVKPEKGLLNVGPSFRDNSAEASSFLSESTRLYIDRLDGLAPRLSDLTLGDDSSDYGNLQERTPRQGHPVCMSEDVLLQHSQKLQRTSPHRPTSSGKRERAFLHLIDRNTYEDPHNNQSSHSFTSPYSSDSNRYSSERSSGSPSNSISSYDDIGVGFRQEKQPAGYQFHTQKSSVHSSNSNISPLPDLNRNNLYPPLRSVKSNISDNHLHQLAHLPCVTNAYNGSNLDCEQQSPAGSKRAAVMLLDGEVEPYAARYVCEQCGKAFSRPSALSTHLNSHVRYKLFYVAQQLIINCRLESAHTSAANAGDALVLPPT